MKRREKSNNVLKLLIMIFAITILVARVGSVRSGGDGGSSSSSPAEPILQPVAIASASPTDISGSFIPSIGSTIAENHEAFLGRMSTYTGSAIGTPGDTIKWRVTITGPTALTPDMLDLDEVGWEDLVDSNIQTFHYPFKQSDNNLVALGSCDNPDTHANDCLTDIGFSLDDNDKFTNADKIKFNSNAPDGSYIIRYELVDTFGTVDTANDQVLSNAYEVQVTLLDTTGPEIADVTNQPVNPTCSDNPVSIFATIRDPSGIQDTLEPFYDPVKLTYKFKNAISSDGVTIPMDLVGNDGYMAEISLPTLIPNRDNGLVVSYEIKANDTLGNSANTGFVYNYTYDCLPPTAKANGPYTGQEGSQVTFDASGSSDSASNIVSYGWEFGDGSTSNDPNPTHVYDDNGNYTIILTVTDSAGNQDTDTTYALISNKPPVADANGPYECNEGNSVTLDGSATDVAKDFDTLTFAWDLDNDGEFDDSNIPNPEFKCMDDMLDFPVILKVTDKDVGIDEVSSTVTVNNIAPTANANGPYTGDEGTPISFTATYNDPGTLDTHTFLWDFGDGSSSDEQNTTHIYIQDGVYTVNLTVTDKDGAYDSDITTATIGNVAPTVDKILLTPNPGKEGMEISLTASFSNPGVNDVHTAKIDWGDGTVNDGFIDELGRTVTGTHVYKDEDDGEYEIKVTVSDEVSSGSNTTSLVIGNAAPELSNCAVTSGDEGSSVALSCSFTDAGTNDIHTANVNWGDGTEKECLAIVQPTVNLGSASNFAILAGSAVTNIPTSAITGDVGLSPSSGSSYAGLTAGEVTGIIYAVDDAGPAGSMSDATLLAAAKEDLTTAYLDVQGRAGPAIPISGDLNGLTLAPGLYESGTSIEISPGGKLYLDAGGDANAVFIIRSASTITTESTSQVILAGGAQAKNVYWLAGSSATLGTNSVMKGTILALDSITLLTGANLEGRALARNAAVTLDSSVITVPTGEIGVSGSGTIFCPHIYSDNSTYTVNLTVTDNDGGIGQDTTTATILDGIPTASFTEEPTSPGEGQLVQFRDTSTSPADDIEEWFWDFGDELTSADRNPTHTYLDDGEYMVTLTVTDSDGSTSTAKETKVVMNVAPVVEAPGDMTTDEGTKIFFEAAFTDAGKLDTHRIATINWGDGKEDNGVVTESDGSGIVTGMHTYADNNDYIVNVTVWDDSFDYDSDLTMVTVNNVAPTVLAAANQTVAKKDVVTISTEFTDPGVLDKHTCLIDWGDGSQPTTECIITEQNSPAGTVSGSHVYGNGGTFTVNITVSDELDSGSNTSTAKVGDFVIDLKQGWNLFSVPKVLENNGLATLASDLDYSIILTYKDGQWIQPATVEPLKAYWINMDQQGKLLLRFKDTSCTGDTCPVPGARQLNAGWELIGYTDTAPLESEFALKSIEGSYSQWFGFVANTWISHIFDQTPDKMMLPGQGFWVFMTQPSTLAVLSF